MGIDHIYTTGAGGVAVHMKDGSIYYVTGFGYNSVSVSFAPDGLHYPEQCDERGRKPEGPFYRMADA